MQRSLLVQTLLNMATGSGGAKLEELVVDAAGTFDAGSGKGYNPVTVPSGSVNVLGEKGVVSNNSVVVTPKAQVVGGWVNSGETSGSGVGVTASDLVSGTLNVSSDGVQDVTNYQNISVPSAGHSASAHKGVVSNHSVTVTPRSTATQGFVQAGTVEGTGVSVSASELVSGLLEITQNGAHDVTNYSEVNVAVQSGAENPSFLDSSSPTNSSFTVTSPGGITDWKYLIIAGRGTVVTNIWCAVINLSGSGHTCWTIGGSYTGIDVSFSNGVYTVSRTSSSASFDSNPYKCFFIR